VTQVPPEFHELAPYLKAVGPYLDRYGYWAIFLGVMIEDFGVPLPGETLLIAGSILAALGQFKVGWILLIGFSGAIIGDNIGYAIGYYGGRRFVIKYGRYFFLSRARLHRLEGFFESHGGKIIVVARFIEGLRQFNGLVAGIGQMRWRRFLAFNIVGALLWSSFWVGIVYFLGSRIDEIFGSFRKFEIYILAGSVAVGILLLAWHLLSRFLRRRKDGN